VEDAKAYIESGILELYVLGELTAAEKAEVERMAAAFEEVRSEITAIEIALENYALAGAMEPSEKPLQNLMKVIAESETRADAGPLNSTQISMLNDSALSTEASLGDGTVPGKGRSHSNEADFGETGVPQAKLRRLQYALAACVALLAVSVVALVSINSKLDKAETQLISLRSEKDRLATRANYLQQTSTELQKVADMINDPNWAVVKLAGTKGSPKSKMTVYWNRESEDVVVDKSRMALPANDEEHQYQLWAMVQGKPVNLGVFDMKADSTDMLLIMKEISKAQAFAVTLEKRGGSVNPTMENLLAMGGVSGQ
jgi:anti-sigma-K factor RskA